MFEEERFEGAVATLDVLGFINRTSNCTTEEARDIVVGPLIYGALYTQFSIMKDLKRWGPFSPLGFLYFADTVVLYLPLKPNSIHSSPENVMESIVYACTLMTAFSIWLNIPLRGAISYGECLICRDPLYFLGQPFLEAHKLEQEQEWAGVAVCNSAAHYTSEAQPRLVSWDVPLKNRTERLLVVNWPASIAGPALGVLDEDFQQATQGPPDWEACFGSDPNVKRKRDHTVAFFEAQHRVGGESVGPEQRGRVKDWKALYRLSRKGMFSGNDT